MEDSVIISGQDIPEEVCPDTRDEKQSYSCALDMIPYVGPLKSSENATKMHNATQNRFHLHRDPLRTYENPENITCVVYHAIKSPFPLHREIYVRGASSGLRFGVLSFRDEGLYARPRPEPMPIREPDRN